MHDASSPATRSVVVTGCSTGIGRATALHLAGLGHRVFAGVRRSDDGQALVEEAGTGIVPLVIDVSQSASIAAAVATLREAGCTHLHGLVNNAGIGIGGPMEGLSADRWRQQFEVNVFGQVAVTQALLPLLRPAKGRIVFVSSVAAFTRPPFMGPYAASKAALDSIAGSWRQELASWDLGVSVVRPGVTRTAIWGKSDALADELLAEVSPDVHGLYEEEIAAMRRGLRANGTAGVAPEVVARAIAHALFARRPRAAYNVGSDTKAARVLEWLLPERAAALIFRTATSRASRPT